MAYFFVNTYGANRFIYSSPEHISFRLVLTQIVRICDNDELNLPIFVICGMRGLRSGNNWQFNIGPNYVIRDLLRPNRFGAFGYTAERVRARYPNREVYVINVANLHFLGLVRLFRSLNGHIILAWHYSHVDAAYVWFRQTQ